MSQITEPDATQLALGVIDELRALLTRCAEALERQADAAEIQVLAVVDRSRADDVLEAYYSHVAAELAEAYDGDQPEGGER